MLRPCGTAVYATAGEMMASTGRPVPVSLAVRSQWSRCDFRSSRFSSWSFQSWRQNVSARQGGWRCGARTSYAR